MSILLNSTTDKLELVRSSNADIVFATFMMIADHSSVPMQMKKADSKVGAFNLAGTDDISGSPGANESWSVWTHVRNDHASASNDITLRLVKAGGTARNLIKVTLYAGWKLICTGDDRFMLLDANGGIVGGAVPASDTIAGVVQMATASDMAAATSQTLVVSPGRQQLHPSAAKVWGKTVGASTTVLGSYGLSSVTNIGTGRCLPNFAVPFVNTNYVALVTPEFTATTYAVANDRKCHVRNGGATTSGCELNCIDSTATTNLLKDPQNWNFAFFGPQ